MWKEAWERGKEERRERGRHSTRPLKESSWLVAFDLIELYKQFSVFYFQEQLHKVIQLFPNGCWNFKAYRAQWAKGPHMKNDVGWTQRALCHWAPCHTTDHLRLFHSVLSPAVTRPLQGSAQMKCTWVSYSEQRKSLIPRPVPDFEGRQTRRQP